jgi:ABC-type polysaccharide/polyol phosphate export permease
MKKLAELFRYRNLLHNLVATELKLRYRRSVLGFLWTMLNPLLMMIILAFAFSQVMRMDSIKDYAVLLFAGLLPWQFFSQSVMLSLMSIVGKGPLLKKVYIPKAIIPLSAVLASLINFLLAFVPLLLIMVGLGHHVGGALGFLPLAVVFMALFTTGCSFVFACLNVFFRDFSHMTEVLLQAWFYFSPVLYTVKMIPERYRFVFEWNPMLYLIDCFRSPIYDNALPAVGTIYIALISSLVACAVGFLIFVRFERNFVLMV